MLSSQQKGSLGLYLRNQVCLTFAGHRSVFGKLQEINQAEEFLRIDDETYSFDSIQDVEYIGEITDYHTMQNYGEIGRYNFDLQALAQSFDPKKVVYGEFDCKIACHLELGPNGIQAVNIRLLESTHRLNTKELGKNVFLYRFEDNSYLIGRLEQEDKQLCVSQPGKKGQPLDIRKLADITKAPEINDYVIVTKNDGSTVRGTVSANDEMDFVIIGDDSAVSIVAYAEISQLRYRGNVILLPASTKGAANQIHIAVNPQKKDFTFLCKPAYCRDPGDVQRLSTAAAVTFVAGVNDRCLIAKDVAIDAVSQANVPDAQSLVEGIGVVVYFDRVKGIGYIGDSYITKGYQQLMGVEQPSAEGRISFTANQLDFSFSYSKICVVSYTFDPNARYRKASSVKLVEAYPYESFAQIHIGPDSKVTAVPTDIAFLPLFKARDVEITCKDDTIRSGWLQECGEEEIVLVCQQTDGTKELTVRKEDIARVRAYGTVGSYRQDSGTGYIDNYWFHINNLRQNTEAPNIVPGRKVLYALVNTFKGKFYMADDISVIKDVPVHGYLTQYDGAVCGVYPASEYGKTLQAQAYPIVSLRSDIAGKLDLLDLKQYDYPISYLLRKNRFETCIVITHVDYGAPKPKMQLGYVLKYIQRADNEAFGFITLPDDLENQLSSTNRKGSIYFRESDLRSGGYGTPDTRNFYYTVAFSLASDKVAGNVTILSQEKLPSVPASRTAPPDTEIKRLPLASVAGENRSNGGENTRLGLIAFCSTHIATINSCFYNSKYTSTDAYPPSIVFDPSVVPFSGEANLKTNRYTYLVRFAVKPGGEAGSESAAVDETQPIEVLQAFSKHGCVRIAIEQDHIVIESLRPAAKPEPAVPPVMPPVSICADIPALADGESVMVLRADQSLLFSTFRGKTEDSILLENGQAVLMDEISRLYRFGVVTGFNMSTGTATINGMGEFSLDIAEAKMINILKNQVNLVRLHVLYSCSGSRVDEVRRIPDAYLEQIPWQQAQVTGCIPDQRQIIAGGSISHYISVLSDGMINRTFKQNQLLDQWVFVRKVTHLFLQNGQAQPALTDSAVDIHCKLENATIQYDAGRDIYLAYRNPTHFYPINGPLPQLKALVGNVVPVEFETAANPSGLQARLGDVTQLLAQMEPADAQEVPASDEAGEMEDPSVIDLAQTSLVSLCLMQTQLNKMLIRGVTLDETGMPVDSAQAQRAYGYLRGHPGADSMFMIAKLAAQFPDLELSDGSGDRQKQIGRTLSNALQKRCREIGTNANAVFGEHTYYLTTLLHHPIRCAKSNDRRPSSVMTAADCLYQLFLTDFGSRQDLINHIQSNRPVEKSQLKELLLRQCGSVEEFVAHLMLLDKTSVEQICQILEENTSLRNQVSQYAGKVDDMIHEQKFSSLVQALRDRYARDKSRFRNAFAELYIHERVCASICDLINHMQARFLKLVCLDDTRRFERLLRCCLRAVDYLNKPDFVQQDMELKLAYQEICELEKEVLSHPTRECVEILMLNKLYTPDESILSKVRYEITTLINQLYQNSSTVPQLTCVSDDSEIPADHPKIWLILKNGTANMNIQPADNIELHLESYSEDASVPNTVPLSQTHLAAGEQLAVEVDIDLFNPDVKKVVLGWSVHYTYSAAFSDGSPQKKPVVFDDTQPLEFLISSGERRVKNIYAANPYKEPAGGQPLLDSKMFFGREKEKKSIWDSIVQNKDGRQSLIPGSAVIIHGQKKCGKTSLVYQIRNEIQKSESLRNQAIVLEFNNILEINGGAEALGFFRQNFYRNILSAFRMEIHKNHPDVEQMLRDHDFEIPSSRKLSNIPPELIASYFDAFFKEFALHDEGKHVVFLVMDEFTLLCTTILKQIQLNPGHNSIETIPNFIKTFSQYGFVQLIIGHEAMMQTLGTLGVLNHTSEFAKSIEISALARPDARELVRRPMCAAFGEDVYSTILGGNAVEELLDLSGCSPTYLMRLCDRMFEYYVDPHKCTRSKILPADVENMTQEYIRGLLLKDFDVLLVEDGDDVGALDERATFKFLRCVADISSQSFDGRTADLNQVRQQLERLNREQEKNHGQTAPSGYFEMEKFDSIRNLLEARRVISTVRGGRIQVNVGLFCEFITQKYGGR